jgi:erythromycin esterase
LNIPPPAKRRSVHMAVIVVACVALVQAQDRSARIVGLSKNASPIRSIDPSIADDDFADLKPLMTAIGHARIVVLGEESHGDGATFLAKGRLVKFLHQKMRFDVLAWEAGLFNCQDMDAAVRSPVVPLEDAVGRGMYPIWGSSAQVRPVFEYARMVARTKRPLEMIGFDHQFSGIDGPGIRWRDAMIAFIDKAGPAILTGPLRSSLMNDAGQVFNAGSSPAEIRSVAERWKTLPALLDNARAKLESVHGARFARMMRRTADDAIISLEGLARFRESGGQFKSADNNLRDQRMAENLIWLANDRYKGRRVIVWAASFHALHEPSAIDLGTGSGFTYKDVVTMGQVVRRSFGRQLYTVGFTAADGEAGNPAGGQAVQVRTSEDGSLEDLFLRVGHHFSFVDFRTLSESARWLHQPISARMLAYSPIETDWTRQFDGVVFTYRMFPSTTRPMVPDGAVLTDPPLKPRHGARD